MAKRIITKIGDVFCVEIDGEYKCFFQFIGKDIEQLNSSIIRVFKTRYPIEYKPVIKDIVKDEILFYAHTILKFGVEFEAWYKVGKSNELGLNNLNKIIWGTVFQYKNHFNYGTHIIKEINPLENWTIWEVNNKSINVGILPKKYYDLIENGIVISYSSILERIKYGYYLGTHWMYDIIKRRPIAGVNSYTKREIDDNVCYFHYIGEDIHREIIVTPQGVIKLTQDVPERNGYTFHARKFWEINWDFKDHISEDDFLTAWNKCT